MAGVYAIGLGTLLATLQGPGLRWLGKMRLDTSSPKLLDHVAPTSGCLYGDSDLLIGELLTELIEPLSEALASGRADLATMYFAGLHLHVVEGDLLPVHVETAYNIHVGPPQAAVFTRHA